VNEKNSKLKRCEVVLYKKRVLKQKNMDFVGIGQKNFSMMNQVYVIFKFLEVKEKKLVLNALLLVGIKRLCTM
jgi:hypothetical protein